MPPVAMPASPIDATEIPLDPHFIGFGRAATGVRRRMALPHHSARAACRDRTESLQAPHIALSVFGRGLLKRLATRIYFADCAENDADPILDERARRAARDAHCTAPRQ